MTIEYAHLSDYATISRDSKLSIIGIFETLYADEFPFTFPTLTVSVGLRVEALDGSTTAELQIEILDPDAQQVAASLGKIHIKDELPTVKNINITVPFQLTKFLKPGAHCIELKIDGTLERSIDFNVSLQQQP